MILVARTRTCVLIGLGLTCAVLSSGQSCLGPSLSPTPPNNNGGNPPVQTSCGLVGSNCEVATGASPNWVAMADFDGDGDNDLATANFGGDSVSIFVNEGQGVFALARNLPAGDTPSSVIATDFSRDGRPDLLVSTFDQFLGPSVMFFRNLGGAAFANGVSYASSSVSEMVTSADLDNNGGLDAITANSFDDSVSLLAGGGNGAFGVPVIASAGNGPSAVVAADLDNDGDVDLAVSNELDDAVAVLRNQGIGNFLPPILFHVGSLPRSIAAADFDNDGDIDLVTANTGSVSDGADTLSVLLNNGNGTFATARSLAVGANPVFVEAVDLNRDGRADLAVVNMGTVAEDSGVAVLLNAGNGTFGAPVLFEAGLGPVALAAGDLDGDGDVDLAVADFADNQLILLGNDGKGSFVSGE